MAVTKEDGTPLSDAELVSILRNWPGGDLGSLALCLGVLVARLIAHPEDQDAWRAADDATLDTFIDEALRIDDPFTSNRRVAACPHMLGEHALETGDRLVIHWTSANRDPEAFGDPDEFRPAENAAKNLVYGIGPHVCPGRGLATTELRVAIRALLDRFDLAEGGAGTRASEPLGGWESMPVRLLARSRS
ncbi:cytochrome P450 [Actinomyces culturomici]|uniref:cytochrome P450 n=1 Tax=Actinomyces culturomici TaxID=1926276 RepID=UPI000E20230A|nr:cytochrome P450 [Actinomyces culturomici]